jgi:subfamily B ATP-binding cassette protein HlyB/CyaB
MNESQPKQPNITAIQCLAAIAHHLGITLSPEKLLRDYALDDGEPSPEKLVRIADENGLKARVQEMDWTELQSLKGVFPLMVKAKEGHWLALVGLGVGEAGNHLALVDPRADSPEVKLITTESFLGVWSGTVVLVKRVFSATDTAQPFGLRWFIPEIARQKEAFRDVFVASIVLMFLALASPIFFQLVLDKVLAHESYSTLYVLTIGILIATLFETAFTYLRQYLLLGATNKIDMRLTRRAFSHLLSLPIQFFESTSSGVIMRHIQQLEKIRGFLTGQLFFTVIEALGLLVFAPMLFFYSPKLAVIVILFAMAMALVIVALIKPFQARLNKLYTAEGQRQALLVETIHGMRTVKSLALESVRRRDWNDRSANSILTSFNVAKISITAQAITQTLQKSMMVAVIAFGAQSVFDHSLTVGALIAFQMIAGRVVGPLVQIVGLVHEYQEVALSVRMLGEIMNHPSEGRRGGSALRPKLTGGISFDQVTFRYPGATNATLDSVMLNIKPGMVVGIVGRSGSGKTTLTRLIQGMYGVTEGVIRMDGVDIREIDLQHLRSSIGVVLQDNFMFRGTVRENIAATKPNATLQEVISAAQAAGADEFIERLPQGYDTVLEENASNLSGGQKQRLSIARAILPAPRILILDEAASALDPESEAIFIDNLSKIAIGKTVLMVSHRLSTLVSSDAILVFERGRVADYGTHAELVSRCATYQQLWEQQTRHF